jgi:predicted phage-related endonuclease
MLTQINKPEHGSQAWLDVRWKNDNGEARIAASAAAAVHGQHPFISVTDLAVELLSDTAPEPKEANSAMLRGTTLEAPIRDWAAKLLGHSLTEPDILYCYDEPGVRLISTIDSMSQDGRVFEQKTTNKIWRGELPDYWYWQGVQQAICTGVPEITWVIFDSTLDLHFHIQAVSSDEKQAHIDACRKFLACIDMGMMPDDAVLEYRHVQDIHSNAQPSKEIELPMSALDTLENYLAIKTQREQLETTEDLLKAELCNVLGDAEYGLIQDELVCSWKSSTRESFDSKAFKAAHPALFDKFKKTTTVRTFRVAKDRK